MKVSVYLFIKLKKLLSNELFLDVRTSWLITICCDCTQTMLVKTHKRVIFSLLCVCVCVCFKNGDILGVLSVVLSLNCYRLGSGAKMHEMN